MGSQRKAEENPAKEPTVRKSTCRLAKTEGRRRPAQGEERRAKGACEGRIVKGKYRMTKSAGRKEDRWVKDECWLDAKSAW